MASKGILNLTLDEIIQRKRGFKKNLVKNGNKKNLSTRPGGGGGFQPKFNNQDLSSKLANRLSRGPGGFNTNSGFRRNGAVANQLRPSTGNARKSVHSRLTMNTPRKAVNVGQGTNHRNIKTKNAEDFHPVRITNGAIVKGLRSDQLLLQKLNQHKSKTIQSKLERIRTLHDKREQAYERSERKESWRSGKSSRVSMDVNHGLMVSFANEVVKKPKPVVQKTRRYSSPPPRSSASSSSTSSDSEDSSDAAPSTSRRVSTEPPKDPLASILRLGLERPPPPKPHRQVLDPAVQKEIAALQGYEEAHSVGPGPGVKGFKMMPSRTKSSLHERFTIERNVND